MYMGNKFLQIANVPNGTVNPIAGDTGEMFFNISTSDLMMWFMTSWVSVTGSDTLASGSFLPASGDLAEMFYLTTDQKVYIWTGTFWKVVGGTGYGTSNPISGNVGDLFFNLSDGKMYVWSGTSWEPLNETGYTGSQGATGFRGSIGPSGNVGAPSNLGYVPISRSGDTMDGPLYLSGNPVSDNQISNKAYADAQVAPKFNTPDGTTAQYVRGNGSLGNMSADNIGLGAVQNTSDANKPVTTALQNALGGKYNVTGGNLLGNVNIITTTASLYWTGSGNQHIWSQNANGSERGIIWNDQSDFAWRIRIRGSLTWGFLGDGDWYLPGNIRVGGSAWMYQDANMGGNIWQNWGDWYMFGAIDRRITDLSSWQTQQWMVSLDACAVGTYCCLASKRNPFTSISINDIVDGSKLEFWRFDKDGGWQTDGSPPGAWKCMGASIRAGRDAGIFMRVW